MNIYITRQMRYLRGTKWYMWEIDGEFLRLRFISGAAKTQDLLLSRDNNTKR